MAPRSTDNISMNDIPPVTIVLRTRLLKCGTGLWKVFLKFPTRTISLSGLERNTSLIRLELFALAQALRRLPEEHTIHIVTCSIQLIDEFSSWPRTKKILGFASDEFFYDWKAMLVETHADRITFELSTDPFPIPEWIQREHYEKRFKKMKARNSRALSHLPQI